ncbi:hypothetical protein SLE2022_230280 [Rubroshorea leprosula]
MDDVNRNARGVGHSQAPVGITGRLHRKSNGPFYLAQLKRQLWLDWILDLGLISKSQDMCYIQTPQSQAQAVSMD